MKSFLYFEVPYRMSVLSAEVANRKARAPLAIKWTDWQLLRGMDIRSDLNRLEYSLILRIISSRLLGPDTSAVLEISDVEAQGFLLQ